MVLGGVSVAPGDIVSADRDGVAVVKKARIKDVVQELDSIIAKEASMEAEVISGKTLPDWVADAKENMVIDYID